MNPVELTPLKTSSDSEDSLEPPFEVHGISQTAQTTTFPPFQTTITIPTKPTSIEDFAESDSDDQAPPSMLFEQRPLLNPAPRPPEIPFARRRQRYEPEKVIESWADVQNLDEFLTRVYGSD